MSPLELATDDQQAALGTSTDGLLATHLASCDSSGSDNVPGITCTEAKSATLECDSPAASPCLNPSTARCCPVSDGIDYLDLNDNEMDKWPGVDPESRYQSALNYKVM